MDIQQFEARKREHIRHSLNPEHQASGLSGLDRIQLVHEALPDLNLAEIQLGARCLSGQLSTPFYIAGMTAGHPDAAEINRALAQACQERGWAMGIGSQRRDLEAMKSSEKIEDLSKSSIKNPPKNAAKGSEGNLRQEAPSLVLFANIGISQLIDTDVIWVRRLVEELGAQALEVHVNALQEAMQPEGTPQFRGSFKALQRICEELGYPVILKETGCGFSLSTLKRLSTIGLAAIDVSGLGGTHWGRIEGSRSEQNSIHARAAATFSNWGESTVDSVRAAVGAGISEIWASGGVRSGLDAAKLIALGAHRVGYAKPALEAALRGPDELRVWMETQEYELRVALFCTGSIDCEALRKKEGVWRQCGI